MRGYYKHILRPILSFAAISACCLMEDASAYEGSGPDSQTADCQGDAMQCLNLERKEDCLLHGKVLLERNEGALDTTQQQISTSQSHEAGQPEIRQKSASEPCLGAVVYVKSLPKGIAVQRGMEEITLVPKNGILEPKETYLQVGQKVKIPYADRQQHVFAWEGVRKKIAGRIEIKGASEYSMTPKEWDEGVRIVCHLHAGEIANLVVLPNQFFAVSGKDGVYQVKNPLPPGKYRVRAYHRSLGEDEKDIEILLGQKKVETNFNLRKPQTSR